MNTVESRVVVVEHITPAWDSTPQGIVVKSVNKYDL